MKAEPVIIRSWDDSPLLGDSTAVPDRLAYTTIESCSPYFFNCLKRFAEEQKQHWRYQILSMKYDPHRAQVIIQCEILNY